MKRENPMRKSPKKEGLKVCVRPATALYAFWLFVPAYVLGIQNQNSDFGPNWFKTQAKPVWPRHPEALRARFVQLA